MDGGDGVWGGGGSVGGAERVFQGGILRLMSEDEGDGYGRGRTWVVGICREAGTVLWAVGDRERSTESQAGGSRV